MTMEKIDQQLQSMLRTVHSNNQRPSHNISSSSVGSTMIPTPGMLHSSGSRSSLVPMDNIIVSTSNASTVGQTTNRDPTANGSVGAGNMASFSASNGPNQNGYQQLPFNVPYDGSSGNGMSRELSQMIPTPGLINPQPLSTVAEYSHVSGLSRIDPNMVPQQLQQKQYVESQTSGILQGQRRAGMSSNVKLNTSAYGLSDGVLSGGLGLIGTNMQPMNGLEAPLGYSISASYGSAAKPSHQQFDRQNHQVVVPTSLPQQSMPMAGHRYSNSDYLSDPRNLHRSAASFTSSSSQKVNSTVFQSTSLVDSSQPMNLYSSQAAHKHLQNSQQQIHHFQYQQFQQPHQPNERHIQHQHQQNTQHQHSEQLISVSDAVRQSSAPANFGIQSIQEHGIESCNDSLLPQATQQMHLSEGPQYVLHTQTTETQSVFSNLSNVSRPDELQQSWCPQLKQKSQMVDDLLFEQQLQGEFTQRLNGQDEAQQPQLRLDGCMNQSSSEVTCGLNPMQKRNYHNQMRWLLFLLHSRKCSVPEGSCKEVNCIKVRELLLHMDRCNIQQCRFPRCSQSKLLLRHYGKCQAEVCPVCIPVRKFISSCRMARNYPLCVPSEKIQGNDTWKVIGSQSRDNLTCKNGLGSIETSEIPESSPKCLKVQHSFSSLVPKREFSPVSLAQTNLPHASMDTHTEGSQKVEKIIPSKTEVAEMEADSSIGFVKGRLPFSGDPDSYLSKNLHSRRHDVEHQCQNEINRHAEQETNPIEQVILQTKFEVKPGANVLPADLAPESKSGKPKIKGVSLTELFTPEQIKEHIVSLRQWIGQSKAKAEKNQAMEHSMSENACQLCAVEKLMFEPPPIYCTPCGARIKRNAMYYTIGSGDTRHYFCIPCYNEARGDTIEVDGSAFPKARLEKKKNDEETEEGWVQCDRCEAWQHQICALFNGRRNDGEAEYNCPKCYIEEIQQGERKPLPQSAVLGAKDLPSTILSDHIERRLFRRLKQEREERARHLGKSSSEVPGVEALVVRVVSSVDKKLDVKPRFLEIFQEDNYPIEFPYKSKVILLFQKIEGVEVCLFGMYVQEFGSECQFPNQRRVYLSYLDSVKYFRPEIKTVTGEALRTFVYHEILIGYLEYCKIRGFTSCYIWACPPLKGEDYILYCHPEIQKTPKSDKLREWYLAMLRKAARENIVVELTNLYDHFFVTTGESKAKVTAARLPYFDGDYWPGAAEDMINQLRQEEDGGTQQKKGKTKKMITKRALKAAGQSDLSGNASKDALLMQKLGETIFPMKEDFIMVHLQHSCTHCCLLLVSGTRWVCRQCKNFQLCEKCYHTEQRVDKRDQHPINSREKHNLYPVEISGIPSDTKDKDEILESEFFDTRQAFLSLCQGNHYQYDTLRRAKHSSMMVLYHLHNPTAPAFVTTCTACHHDIEAGQGWRCETCPDFDVCDTCYQKGGVDHPHKLTNHPSMADRDAQNQEARQQRVLQLRKMLDLLVHASQCRNPHCNYPNCRKVKGLFRHGMQCKTRVSGGCPLCKKMWYLLQLHARACKESACYVPRCKDLKEHLKRSQQQSDSRRRAAVMEMMRQRAAEVAGGD